MAKERHFYLIKYWDPRRGQTQESPGGYYCGGWVSEHIPRQVKSLFTYSSRARAERAAAKETCLCTEVIEVPPELVVIYE